MTAGEFYERVLLISQLWAVEAAVVVCAIARFMPAWVVLASACVAARPVFCDPRPLSRVHYRQTPVEMIDCTTTPTPPRASTRARRAVDVLVLVACVTATATAGWTAAIVAVAVAVVVRPFIAHAHVVHALRHALVSAVVFAAVGAFAAAAVQPMHRTTRFWLTGVVFPVLGKLCARVGVRVLVCGWSAAHVHNYAAGVHACVVGALDVPLLALTFRQDRLDALLASNAAASVVQLAMDAVDAAYDDPMRWVSAHFAAAWLVVPVHALGACAFVFVDAEVTAVDVLARVTIAVSVELAYQWASDALLFARACPHVDAFAHDPPAAVWYQLVAAALVTVAFRDVGNAPACVHACS